MTEVKANYDDTWKQAITDYFPAFLSFFYPHLYQIIDWTKTPVSLDKELEQITASSETGKGYVDKLYKVWLLNQEEMWILIHIEIQSQYDKEFPKRIFVYNYRAFDLYEKPVISLAILGDENKSWRPSVYEYGLGGSQLSLKFDLVKLIDYDWEELQQNENIFAIVVMAHLKTKTTISDLTEREQWKWNLVRGLYNRGLTKLDIVNLFKVIDKMMALPPKLQTSFEKKLTKYEEEGKMPLLSYMEERGMEKGLKTGIEQGLKTGRKQSCRDNIIKLVQRRLKVNLSETLINRIHQIDDLSVLEDVFLQAIDITSVDEFAQLLNSK
jgi:hypothetical protein